MEYPREPRRRAEFIFPPNLLKLKVGSGGLDEKVIAKAQKLIDEAKVDFVPVGQRYLTALQEGIKVAVTQKGTIDDETLIATMLYPSMQLKANGGMFGFPLITSVASRLIRFIEQIREPNFDATEVIKAFHNSMQAILLMGESDKKVVTHGEEIYAALDEACMRYFEKYGY